MTENGQIVYLHWFSQRSHFKAESILNLYTNSAKYKISKLCYAALSENRQQNRKRSLKSCFFGADSSHKHYFMMRFFG